jgi:hypothetical protein
LIKALDKKVPKYTEESLAKKKSDATEAKKKNSIDGLSSFSKTAFWQELQPNLAVVEEPANPTFKIQRVHEYMYCSTRRCGSCSSKAVHTGNHQPTDYSSPRGQHYQKCAFRRRRLQQPWRVHQPVPMLVRGLEW